MKTIKMPKLSPLREEKTTMDFRPEGDGRSWSEDDTMVQLCNVAYILDHAIANGILEPGLVLCKKGEVPDDSPFAAETNYTVRDLCEHISHAFSFCISLIEQNGSKPTREQFGELFWALYGAEIPEGAEAWEEFWQNQA